MKLLFVILCKIIKMVKSSIEKIDYYDGYNMLAMVSLLTDYKLCFFINNSLRFNLEKKEDLFYDFSSDKESGFSYYYYKDTVVDTDFILIGNKNNKAILIPSQKAVNYFLLIKNAVDESVVKDVSSAIRKINGVAAVLDVNMHKIKKVDLLLETIELHELKKLGNKF